MTLKFSLKSNLAAASFAIAAMLIAMSAMAADQFITIGTGTGAYYSTGGAICGLVNDGRRHHGIRCVVEPIEGSADSIVVALRSNKGSNTGVVRSDFLYDAYHGNKPFKKAGPYTELRVLFSLPPESMNIIARRDANIKHIDNLAGKKINIGSEGSDTRKISDLVLNKTGKIHNDFTLVSELSVSAASQKLCDNEIDAFFSLAINPSDLIKNTAIGCDVNLVTVDGPTIDALTTEFAFYDSTVIPGGVYKGSPDNVPSFGAFVTLVSSTKISADIIYDIVKSVFEDFDQFKKRHPAFAHLTEKEMITKGISGVPLHDGAKRYYQERGWIQRN